MPKNICIPVAALLHRGIAGEKDNAHIVVTRIKRGQYKVVSNNFTDRFDPEFAFQDWSRGVRRGRYRDTDLTSCFGLSDHLTWKGVTMRPWQFQAPSIRRLRQALSRVTLASYNRHDL